MSRELLRRLQEERAFDSSPLRPDLGVYHVPFSDLGSVKPLERTLYDAAKRAERLMVVGCSGSGKSSLIEYTLGPLVPEVSPIHVPVFAESADIVTNVQAVAGMIIQRLVQHVEIPEAERKHALQWASSQRSLDYRPSITSFAAGASWSGAGLGAEIRRQDPSSMTLPNPASGTLEIVDHLLNVIKKDNLMPVLIFDDTDRWFREIESENTEYYDIAIGFFGSVLTEIRQLSAGLVVAVHPRYLENEQLNDHIVNTIEVPINIPVLSSVDALGKVLYSRVAKHSPADADNAPSLDDVLLPEALDRLYDLYQCHLSGSLREVIRKVHVALADACNGGFEVITPELITQANW